MGEDEKHAVTCRGGYHPPAFSNFDLSVCCVEVTAMGDTVQGALIFASFVQREVDFAKQKTEGL